MNCCLELLNKSQNDHNSPFSEIFILDFYDAPIAGIAKCVTCNALYKFFEIERYEDVDESLLILVLVFADYKTLIDYSEEKIKGSGFRFLKSDISLVPIPRIDIPKLVVATSNLGISVRNVARLYAGKNDNLDWKTEFGL